MSKFLGKIAGLFSKRTMVGMDKAGNRYFTRNESVDGVMKEKRWVIFKGEEDPTSIPGKFQYTEQQAILSFICTSMKMKLSRFDAHAGGSTVLQEQGMCNSNCLVVVGYIREMAELEAKREFVRQNVMRNVGGPDLQSYLRQLQSSEGSEPQEASGNLSESEKEKTESPQETLEPRTTEPTGSGPSFKAGTWQPPS
uniref:NADH dehydrogenase [ubiquinone] 1 alpha subcomplex subunit 12 n=1 Tax=Chenopodium quinoa TaxID=63459 RepID=A0A803LY79_CHEQI